MAIQIKLERGTQSAWTTLNPVLLAGEIVVETNTRQVKIGNGTSTYTQLPYGFDQGPPPATLNDFFG